MKWVRFLLRPFCVSSVAGMLWIQSSPAQSTSSYAHFEGRQTHPVALTPDGTRLLALNTPDARLSVFDVSNPANTQPVLVAEIPVGLEPVSVRARTNDEVWVVNELSDSVSIVSLSREVVVATLSVPDEPADVVFAQGKAFVSCARNRQLRVFEAETRAALATLPLQGNSPRTMAVSADESTVWVAFHLSGNGTTTLSSAEAPPQPLPANPLLPTPPKTALIVSADDPRVPYTVLDHDVAEVTVSDLQVKTYYSGAGTNLFGIAVRPGTQEVWITNTEAHNLLRYEPVLNGRFASNRVTRLTPPSGEMVIHDLDPPLADPTQENPAARAVSLAQPMGLVFSEDGTYLWLAAFGSDRVAKIRAETGEVVARVDVRMLPPAGAEGENSSPFMRGPRAAVLHEITQRLYVLNKLANSLSVIDAAGTQDGYASVLAEVPVGSFDPTPPEIKAGRGYLYDARLSSHGTLSCATCHIDADLDGLAWDLGDPSGEMLTLVGYNNSIHDPLPKNRVLHPMKGPMITQTLRGFMPNQTFHWRGDKPSVQSFNSTFPNLLGGKPLPEKDMDALNDYLRTLKHHPNPNRGLDRSLPVNLEGGNAVRGRDMFNVHEKSHCITCHAYPSGSDNNIDLHSEVGSVQPVKTPPLRTVYQRAQFDRRPGAINISGFGMLKDGTGNFPLLPVGHHYVLEALSNAQEYKDVQAFVLSFDTGTAPAVGHAVTFEAHDRNESGRLSTLTILEEQAALPSTCDVVARGRLAGQSRNLLYDPELGRYRSDRANEVPRSREELLAALQEGDALTFMGVYPGQGPRFSIDRDQDGRLNGDELPPELEVRPGVPPAAAILRWRAGRGDWLLEMSPELAPSWRPLTTPRRHGEGEGGGLEVEELRGADPVRFFRLRRTW